MSARPAGPDGGEAEALGLPDAAAVAAAAVTAGGLGETDVAELSSVADAARPAAAAAPAPTGRLAGLRQSPFVRKVTGYSAGSVIAAFTSEIAFAGSFGALHVGTTLASLIGFVGGAIPNYFLNKRWAWKDQGTRSRRDEILLYALVSIAAFAASAVVTDYAERYARTLTATRGLQVVLVAAAYLAVSGVFFIGKFVAYELVVFTRGPGARKGSGGRRGAGATRSRRRPS